MNKNQTIIIDTGSYKTKIGYQDELYPSVIMPTIIGEPKSQDIIIGVDQKNYFIGNETLGKEELLTISRPI